MQNQYKQETIGWRRQLYAYFLITLFGIGLAITLGTILLVLLFIIIKGAQYFRFDMLWTSFNPDDLTKGGMAPFIVTSLMLLFLTLLITIPFSLITAIYTTEFCKNKTFVQAFKSVLNILNAIPSIIFGIIGVTVFVETFHAGYRGFSILSGALTLALVAMPTLTIAMIEAIEKVPKYLIQSSYAVGATQWQTIKKIILPTSLRSMTGGFILTVSRIIGESAPVYLTVGASIYMPSGFLDMGGSLVTEIFLIFFNPTGTHSTEFIYCLSLVVVLMILVINIILRLIFWRLKKTVSNQRRRKTLFSRFKKWTHADYE